MSDLDLVEALTAAAQKTFARPLPAAALVDVPDNATATPPQGFRFWYDSIIDVMFERPDFSIAKIGESLGRSSRWIYLVVKSDSFKEHYEYRRSEHNDRLTTAIITKASAVAANSLDILLRRLEDNPAAFTPAAALEVSTGMMKMLGMGQPKSGPTVNVQQTTVVAAASPDELRRARELIRSAEASQLAQPQLELRAEGPRSQDSFVGEAHGPRSEDIFATPNPQPNSE